MKNLLLLCLLLLLPLSVGATGLQDPTLPPRTAAVAPTPHVKSTPTPVYSLSSILISANRRLAVINGLTVAEGDRIQRATVQRIEPQEVTLREGKRQWTLTLGQGPVKTLASVITGRITKQ